MKSYFAKHLPVKGEIKEGDKFLINDFHPSGQLRTAYRITTDNRLWDGKDWDTLKGKHYFIDSTPEEGCGFVTELECKKAQLFLCSRTSTDININIDEQQWKEMSVSEKDNYLVKTGQYKVIGPISPDTTWVKEGDEFDKDELIRYTLIHENSGIVYRHYFKEEDIPKHNRGTIIKIKCPCCGSFK